MTFVKLNNQNQNHFDGLMKDLFNEIPATLGKTFREDVFGFPPVNISETKSAYQIEVAAPGMEKTDFTLKLDGAQLTIAGIKKDAIKNDDLKSIRKEFSSKSFKRSFTLDEKIDAANIAARYEAGVLKVELPKREETKTEAKEITVQ